MTAKIFIINGVAEHEYCKPVKALNSLQDAEKFLENAEQYHKQRPSYFNFGDTNDYFIAVQEWLRLHPCGNEADDFDYFEIVKVELL